MAQPGSEPRRWADLTVTGRCYAPRMKPFHSFVAVAIVLGLSACGDDDHEGAAPEGVVYEGGSTDEAWIAIDEAPLVTNDDQAPRLTAPTALDRAATTPPAFEWSAGALASLSPRTPARPSAHASRAPLWSLFLPATARAHLPPVTGDQYRLVLSLGSGEPIRVLTGETTWTPNENAWSRIVAAEGSVTVELVGAYLMSGRVTEGPYASSSPTTLSFGE